MTLSANVKPTMTVYGDGIHDETAAFQAFFDGTHDLVYPDGTPWQQRGGVHRLESPVIVSSPSRVRQQAQWKREKKGRT